MGLIVTLTLCKLCAGSLCLENPNSRICKTFICHVTAWCKVFVFFSLLFAQVPVLRPGFSLCLQYMAGCRESNPSCCDRSQVCYQWATGVPFSSFLKSFYWVLLYYLYSITVWSAAPQTSLWGGPGPRNEPGPDGSEAGTLPLDHHTSKGFCLFSQVIPYWLPNPQKLSLKQKPRISTF